MGLYLTRHQNALVWYFLNTNLCKCFSPETAFFLTNCLVIQSEFGTCMKHESSEHPKYLSCIFFKQTLKVSCICVSNVGFVVLNMAKSAIMHCSDWIRIGSTTTCGDEFVTNTTALCQSVLFLGVMIPWRCIQLYIYWGQLCLFACSNVVLDLICWFLLHYVIQGLFKNWRYCFHC